MPTQEYGYDLSESAAIYVRLETEQGALVAFAVVLIHYEDAEPQTVRVWDNHQGEPHMHRYTRTRGKEPAEKLPVSSAQEGFNMALESAHDRHEEIIRAWLRS